VNLFIAGILVAVLGTALDSWSTQVAIEQYGMREKGTIRPWLQKKLGYFGKGLLDLALIGVFTWLWAKSSLVLAAVWLLGCGLSQAYFAALNYRAIRSKKR
jgi:uncharacterized membrane protein